MGPLRISFVVTAPSLGPLHGGRTRRRARRQARSCARLHGSAASRCTSCWRSARLRPSRACTRPADGRPGWSSPAKACRSCADMMTTQGHAAVLAISIAHRARSRTQRRAEQGGRRPGVLRAQHRRIAVLAPRCHNRVGGSHLPAANGRARARGKRCDHCGCGSRPDTADSYVKGVTFIMTFAAFLSASERCCT